MIQFTVRNIGEDTERREIAVVCGSAEENQRFFTEFPGTLEHGKSSDCVVEALIHLLKGIQWRTPAISIAGSEVIIRHG
jgi:hypothetical protein